MNGAAGGGTDETEGIYTGYRFFDKEGIKPQFPFGFGLSYTNFAFSGLRVKPTSDGGADVSVRVKNTGSVAGADAVQVYVGPPSHRPAGVQFAVRSLAQFDRVELDSGQSQKITLHVPARELSYWSQKDQKWILDSGGRLVSVGDADQQARLPLREIMPTDPSATGGGVTTCSNEQINATIVNGDLSVPKGSWCDLVDVTVRGNLKLNQTAGTRIQGVTVNGNILAANSAGTADPLSANTNNICRSTVHGNLEVHGSAADVNWNIGGCGGNTVDGNLNFHNNPARGNTVSNNTVKGDLKCQSNGTTASGANRVRGRVTGQCVAS